MVKNERVYVLTESELANLVANRQTEALRTIYGVAKQNPNASWNELVMSSAEILRAGDTVEEAAVATAPEAEAEDFDEQSQQIDEDSYAELAERAENGELAAIPGTELYGSDAADAAREVLSEAAQDDQDWVTDEVTELIETAAAETGTVHDTTDAMLEELDESSPVEEPLEDGSNDEGEAEPATEETLEEDAEKAGSFRQNDSRMIQSASIFDS